MHTVDEAADDTMAKAPATQGLQLVEPLATANVPAPQLVHEDAPLSEHRPAPHELQVSEIEAPDKAEYRPAAQLVQLSLPEAMAKVPAAHDAQFAALLPE